MLSFPAAVPRTVVHSGHILRESDRLEGDHPVRVHVEGKPIENGPSEINQPVVYPALDVERHSAAEYPAAPATVARLLCVKQAVTRSRRSRDRPNDVPPNDVSPNDVHPSVGRRRLRRRLVQAAARIERSPEYQRSLSELAELAASFQAVLEPAQRGQWLALEDALLEHVAWLNRSYFHAGAAWGEQHGRSQRQPAPAIERDARRRARVDLEVMVALARVVIKLAKR